MSIYLGIDTSNYTTSCAAFDSSSGEVRSFRKVLPVKSGEKGIRQSDAVFLHTKQLPELMNELFDGLDKPDAVSFSAAPRNVQGSYMPCFLVGECTARSVAAASGARLHITHHQTGHILAALYSCGRLDLLKNDKPFLAFHVSGGTTDLLLCTPCKARVLDIVQAGCSLDLKAGQAVDRAGVMLGLDFPCGAQLEKLALQSDREFRIKPVVKGLDCSLSGLENKCSDMMSKNEPAQDIAKYCLEYIGSAVCEMTAAALREYGGLPIIYAGGVMSDVLIKNMILSRFEGYFAKPEHSCDNAVGVALFGALTEGVI